MKTLRKIGLGFVMALISFSMSSCSDDDDNEPTAPKDVTANYTYALEVNQTFLELADITVSLVTPDGKTSTETITKTKYEKAFSVKEFPTTISAGVTYQWKQGVDASKYDKIDLYMVSQYKYSTGTDVGNKNGVHINNKSVKNDKLVELRELHLKNINLSNYTCKMTKNSNGGVDFNFSAYNF